MAGQPQEPSWTPNGQTPNGPEQTQARPAWPQQPTFTPPEPQQDSYGYQQPTPATGAYPPPSSSGPSSSAPSGYQGQGQGQERVYEQDQVYERAYAQEQSYQPQDQTIAGQDQAYAGQGQQYQGQQYQGQPDPMVTQWQSVPGMPPARDGAGSQRSKGEKGFFASLFDFSFTSMVTPKIIKVLYVLVALWTALVALVILVISFRTGGMAGGLFVLIVVEPIFILLMLGVYRVILEAFMVIFRIYEETRKIREITERQP